MTHSGRERRQRELLLGEWACLGILYEGPTHGFAIASALRPGGELGRVWSLSRSLTYRSIDQLVERELVRATGEEPGLAGGNRTVLAATRTGRAALRRWVGIPVEHLRDLRSELLLKLVIAERCGIDVTAMVRRQRAIVATLAASIATEGATADAGAGSGDGASGHDDGDVVMQWRRESSEAALRFLDGVLADQTS